MKRLKSLFSCVLILIVAIVLASCNNKSVTGEFTDIIASRTSVTMKVKLFDENVDVTSGSFYASVFNKDDELVNSVTFDETSSKEQTKEFTNLEAVTTYSLKLFATYNNKKYTLDKKSFSTTTKGSAEEPIEISTTSGFLNIANDPTGHFKLMGDLDFAEANLSALFTSTDKPFKGSLDGQNHTIKNFKLNASAYCSIFGYSSGTIKNLIISDTTVDVRRSVTSESSMGLLVAVNNGTISNVLINKVTANITSGSTGLINFGLLTGKNGAKGLIENCHVLESTIAFAGRVLANVGGLVGVNDEAKSTTRAYIKNSDTDVVIKFTQDYASSKNIEFNIGGLVGLNKTSIENCFSNNTIEVSTSKSTTTSEITYEVCIGGLIGNNLSNSVVKTSAVASSIKYEVKDTTEKEKTLDINVHLGLFSGNVNKYSILSDCIVVGNSSALEFISATTSLKEDNEVFVSQLIANKVNASVFTTSFVLGVAQVKDINSLATILQATTSSTFNASLYSEAVKVFINLKK